MKHLMLILVIVVTLAWGCAPSDQTPQAATPTPTAAADNEITGMDFESGEVEHSTTELEEPAPEATPEIP